MFSSRTSVARSLTIFALLLMSALFSASCSLPWQQSNAQSSGSKPTTQQLLDALQKNFRNVSAFHVVMQASNTGTPSAERVQILNANGDVVMPDKVKAQATVILSGQSVTINLISIGDKQFITDPITGQWRVIKGLLDPRTLTNPNSGLVSLVSKLQNLSQPTSDSVSSVPCWRVTGQLDAKYLAFFTGGGVPAGTMLQTSACIGKSDNLPYQLKVTGQAATGDLANTSRTFLISNYNENISITAPQF